MDIATISDREQLYPGWKQIEFRSVKFPVPGSKPHLNNTDSHKKLKSFSGQELYCINLKSICMKADSQRVNYLNRLIACAVVCLLVMGCQKSIDRSASRDQSIAGKDPKLLKDFDQVNLVDNNVEYG